MVCFDIIDLLGYTVLILIDWCSGDVDAYLMVALMVAAERRWCWLCRLDGYSWRQFDDCFYCWYHANWITVDADSMITLIVGFMPMRWYGSMVATAMGCCGDPSMPIWQLQLRPMRWYGSMIATAVGCCGVDVDYADWMVTDLVVTLMVCLAAMRRRRYDLAMGYLALGCRRQCWRWLVVAL